MRKLSPEDIKHRTITKGISFLSPVTETAPTLQVCGIEGADELITGICVNGNTISRVLCDLSTGTPLESIDKLRMRAARMFVPSLSEDAPRDARGYPLGYFIYEGLLVDHCRPR